MNNKHFNIGLKGFHEVLESIERSNNSLVCFELDLDIYNNIFKKSPRIKENEKNYKEIISTFDKLNEDMYLAIFKANPMVRQKEEIGPEYWLNNILIQKLFETDEFQYLRNSCSLNYFSSILATDVLGQAIIDNFKKQTKKNKLFGDRLRNYETNSNGYKTEKENLKLLLGQKSIEGKEEEIEKFINSLKRIENKIQGDLEVISSIISSENLIHRSVTFGYKEFISISNTIKSWGLDDGKLTPTSYEEKIEVSLKLRSLKKVREISEMAGRFKASASRLQKRKTKEEGQEICGVQLGNEIHKVLPSEKIFLANENTKKAFYKKYHQKELLTYKHKNNRSKSKGPIICCIDTSASMEGEREVWSKSVAITLLDLAVKQKRDFVAVLFSNKVYKTIEFNKSRIEPNKLYELATFFYGSGTNFMEPLTEALKLISGAKYKYADIVFITDGEAFIDEEFIESFNIQKQKKEFKMIAVNVSDKIEEELNKVNDIQILLSDLGAETVEEANNTLFTV